VATLAPLRLPGPTVPQRSIEPTDTSGASDIETDDNQILEPVIRPAIWLSVV
jgi:hypothetical protein